MFTGIVAETGTIRSISRNAKGATLRVATNFDPLVMGESIAVDGVCLTVMRIDPQGFDAEASLETLSRTTLEKMMTGRRVHLERALAVGERLGGHFVSGHVDGIGSIVSRESMGDAIKMTFEVPQVLAPFIAPKGSIAIDGCSLTVNGVIGNRFDVALVPYTQSETTFMSRPNGDVVNLEADILAKYVARLLGRADINGRVDSPTGETDGISLDLLARQGYL